MASIEKCLIWYEPPCTALEWSNFFSKSHTSNTMSAMSRRSSFIKTIFSLVLKNWPAYIERIARFRLSNGTRTMRSTSAREFFKTNEKMVLINDDWRDIADIVLDVWLFEKKLITLLYTLTFTCKFCSVNTVKPQITGLYEKNSFYETIWKDFGEPQFKRQSSAKPDVSQAM